MRDYAFVSEPRPLQGNTAYVSLWFISFLTEDQNFKHMENVLPFRGRGLADIGTMSR